MILIPEVEIYDVLNKLFLFMKKDFESQVDEQKTILFDIFGVKADVKRTNTFDWFAESKVVFVNRNQDNPRQLQVNFGYNLERSNKPTIHILLPSESPVNSPIGMNLGYESSFIDAEEQEISEVYTQDCSVIYNLLITSDNMSEVILIYNTLKYMFLSLKIELELLGFKNLMFGGGDVVFSQEYLAQGVYSRNFNLQFSYDFSSRELISTKYGGSINVDLIPHLMS